MPKIDFATGSRFLLPFAGVVVFGLLFGALQNLLSLGELSAKVFQERSMGVGVLWAAAELLLLESLLFGIGYAIYIVVKECRTQPGTSFWWPLLFFAAVAIPWCYWLFLHAAGGNESSRLVMAVDHAVNAPISTWVNCSNMFAAVALSWILVAAVFLANIREPLKIPEIARKLKWYQILLSTGAAILMCTTFEIYFLLKWGASFDPQENKIIASVAYFPLIAGVLGSALLLIIFAPSALAIQDAAAALVKKAALDEKFDPAKWAATNGLDYSPVKGVWTILAVLAPVLSGLVQALTKPMF
jgi:hypothetical protein